VFPVVDVCFRMPQAGGRRARERGYRLGERLQATGWGEATGYRLQGRRPDPGAEGAAWPSVVPSTFGPHWSRASLTSPSDLKPVACSLS
jgi:hypothetical protein